MKKYFYLIFMLAAIACNKDEKPVRSSVIDARPVQLKRMVSEGLPSPYFQFTYDSSSYVTRIEHAAGLLQYNLQYENGRLVRMANNTVVNHDTLVYFYQDNRVSRINLVEAGGHKVQEIELSYDEQQRLKELRWNKMNADFSTSLTRKLVFEYNAQGNLSKFEDYRNLGSGLELIQTHLYEKYDDKVNVEANFVIKDVFEHFIFLPQVQLQKNNPLAEKIIGRQNDYSISYNYTFNNGLPVNRVTEMKQTRGASVGTSIRANTVYSY